MTPSASAAFIQAFTVACQQQHITKLVLSKYRGTEPQLQKIQVRPTMIKQQMMLSWVSTYQTRDTTKNYSLADSTALLAQLLGTEFKNAHLLTKTHDWQLSFSKKDKASLLKTPVATEATPTNHLQHNREKQRYLSLHRPFFRNLGITDQQDQLIPAMSRKWKQINKFIEIFQHALADSQLDIGQALHVVDFGSGKGYLTFALHDYLRQQLANPAQVTGVELRDNLVNLCQQTINEHQLQGLQFYQGDVRSYQPERLNVMIALHACDIATDYAIHTGIRLGAEIIMCAPCCHKQLRPQLTSPAILQPVLQHGVHLGQEAEMLTDGIRALLLEAQGYQSQVFEFVALEHTSKNKMILAIKKPVNPKRQQEIYEQIQEIKQFYGIKEHCLESLLKPVAKS
ncbi:class I SAM-dependent methyltransferase [Agitococcus lubricus]|uniref:Methyltransferase family protein n=1 Tax=Agitococcus lubricus TaxID=1077255 RepID=A0A2T5IZF4_9GAMM|nr:SAM-dependent methyltransferase [Agitococcus lubricus]PTQ89390.1 methyltransferase family protein [Agitococcus lubricus]